MTTLAEERREHPRRSVSTPIGIDTERKRGRAGITRDVSAGGLLFQSRGTYRLGEEVEVRFRPPGASSECRTRGTVVRTLRDTETDAFFHHLTAVRFHEPLPEDIAQARPGGYWPRMVIPT